MARIASRVPRPCSASRKCFLPLTDPVFAGAGYLHGERVLCDPFDERVGASNFLDIVHHNRDNGAKIAVARVSDDRRHEESRLTPDPDHVG
jgi:hypothetical protein